MLDWIFEGIVTWISSVMTSLMDAVSGLFLDALGTDMVVMEEYFPFVTKAFGILQYTAWALLFLITAWQLFRAFGGPITDAENPLTLVARSILFAVMIGYAQSIFQMTLDIARAPYTALMEVTMTAEDFTFAGIEEALKNGLVTIVATTSIVGTLLLVILEIALGWNYFKLLLETVERYVVVGVLCYTSPLAFAMGGSKETNSVFRSWCRMVGSQLILLIMNVWFLRAFGSSVGQFIGNGGALTNGRGSIFLWLFCALAFLKCAQRFDSYLSSIGLNVAQTGSSMAMEMMMAARVLSGVGGGPRSAGSVFRGSGAAGSSATSTAAGVASGFANRFKGNSYVRDAVVNGGTRMGAGGSIGFVGRAFGGIAARNGATLSGESISSVASRPSAVSGSIGGEIADRSLKNYMPQLGNRQLKNTQISGGRISTTSVGADGKQTSVEMFNASQFEKPAGPHATLTASDGSQWYQVASGPDAASFYDAPHFSGSADESAQVASFFPDAPDGTVLRSVGEGEIQATSPDGTSSMWYNSAMFEEPDAPHSIMGSANGVDWYTMQPHSEAPGFESGSVDTSQSGATFTGTSESGFGEASVIPSAPVDNPGMDTGSPLSAPSDSYSYMQNTSDFAPMPPSDSPSEVSDTALGSASGSVSLSADEPVFDAGTPISVQNSSVSDVEIPSGMPITEAEAQSFYANPMSGSNDSVSHVEETPAADFVPVPDSSYHAETPEAPAATPASDYSSPVSQSDADFTPAGSTPNTDSASFFTDSEVFSDFSAAYNQALFKNFMPGYEQPITSVDDSGRSDGHFEVRHADGSGTMFFDSTAASGTPYPGSPLLNGGLFMRTANRSTTVRTSKRSLWKPCATAISLQNAALPRRAASATLRHLRRKHDLKAVGLRSGCLFGGEHLWLSRTSVNSATAPTAFQTRHQTFPVPSTPCDSRPRPPLPEQPRPVPRKPARPLPVPQKALPPLAHGVHLPLPHGLRVIPCTSFSSALHSFSLLSL